MSKSFMQFRPNESDLKAIDTIKRYLDYQHRPPGSDEWSESAIIRWAIHSKAGDLSGYAADAKPPKMSPRKPKGATSNGMAGE